MKEEGKTLSVTSKKKRLDFSSVVVVDVVCFYLFMFFLRSSSGVFSLNASLIIIFALEFNEEI